MTLQFHIKVSFTLILGHVFTEQYTRDLKLFKTNAFIKLKCTAN